MYVACPACRALYIIQPAHLRAAAGELHCGACGARFNAAAAVFEQAQQALDYAAQQQQGVASEIDDLVDKALGQVADLAVAEDTEVPRTGDEPCAADDALVRDEMAGVDSQTESVPVDTDESSGTAVVLPPGSEIQPEIPGKILPVQGDRDFFAQPQAVEFGAVPAHVTEPPLALLLQDHADVEVTLISWGAVAASTLLIAVLCGQFIWQQRYQLAEVDGLRPYLEGFCGVLDCDLPLRQEPAQVEMVEREVRDHPLVDGALLVNAAFVNRADFRQAYPVFQISFSDVSGTLVAVRRFAPQVYLLEQRPLAQGLAPGEWARVNLELVDPGDKAVSFQFEFL